MNKLAVILIKFYRKYLSLGKITGVKFCIYEPTCSAYGLECFKRFGFFKALYLTTYRILRCNPFSKGGFDPVPEK